LVKPIMLGPFTRPMIENPSGVQAQRLESELSSGIAVAGERRGGIAISGRKNWWFTGLFLN
jgi:hypothetical protein